jgi:hypothetical protein
MIRRYPPLHRDEAEKAAARDVFAAHRNPASKAIKPMLTTTLQQLHEMTSAAC